MGNLTNDENWAARERLRMIEVILWWRGWLRRNDLMECFGISPAQASGDLQRYQQINRTGLIYHTNNKRYEAGDAFVCKLHKPNLTEAVQLLLGASPGAADLSVDTPPASTQSTCAVDFLRVPQRAVNDKVARTVMLAIQRKKTLDVRYLSVSGSTRKVRTLAPRALAWDGSRWHARCWDEERLEWRDYVLGRMEECRWSKKIIGSLPPDTEWETFVVLKLKLNAALSKEAKAAVKMDYGLKSDTLEVRCRKAMVKYLRNHLGLPWEDSPKTKWVPHFQVVGEKKTT